MKKIKSLSAALCLAIAAATVGLAGCAGSKYDRSTGEYIDDKATTARVKDALGDNKEYKFDDVNVAAFKGTVQLSGWVRTDDQKEKAGELAKSVQGVKEVVNNITVKK